MSEASSGSGSGNLQSSASVPAISFNFSIGQIPATEDPETLRAQLIAAWQRSSKMGLEVCIYHMYTDMHTTSATYVRMNVQTSHTLHVYINTYA